MKRIVTIDLTIIATLDEDNKQWTTDHPILCVSDDINPSVVANFLIQTGKALELEGTDALGPKISPH